MISPDPNFIGPLPRPFPAIRADDRTPWEPKARLVPTDGVYVPLASINAIAKMISGALPNGAGANTALVSQALRFLKKKGWPSVGVERKGVHVVIRPFSSGLAELRKATGRRA